MDIFGLPYFLLEQGDPKGCVLPCTFQNVGDCAPAEVPIELMLEMLCHPLARQQLLWVQVSHQGTDLQPVLNRGVDMGGKWCPDFLLAAGA